MCYLLSLPGILEEPIIGQSGYVYLAALPVSSSGQFGGLALRYINWSYVNRGVPNSSLPDPRQIST